MAVPAGTFQRHTAIGAREDLADIIHDISPVDTPFQNSIARESSSSILTEWQTDVLAAAADNAHIEGDDSAANTATPTTRFGNYQQILKKTVSVAGTLRASNTAGRKDEYSYQLVKRGREIKRDMEFSISQNGAGSAGGAGTARHMAGAELWLWDNKVAKGASHTTPAVASGVPGTAPTDGTAVAITETDLKTAVSNCWDDGGDPNLVLVGSSNKKLISAFSGIATQYKENPGKTPATIIGSADYYVSDFGTHHIVASRYVRGSVALVLDTDYWAVSYLRPMQQEKLAKTGDSDKGHILCEGTLVCKNPLASSKIATLTTP